VNTSNKLPEIKKEAFKKARESLGLSTKDLSGMACLSVRQIEQIENGESSSFYGPQVKVTAAKKVAGLLKLKEEDAFDFAAISPNKKEGSKSSETVAKAAKEIASTVTQTASNDVESLKPSKANVSKKTTEVKQAIKQVIPSHQELGQSKSSKNPKRKLYILVGVAAALVFSIINLRPLFFPEVVKEEVVVVEQTEAAAPADVPADPKTPPASAPEPVVAAVVPVPAPSTECPSADVAAVSYRPDAPKKAGDMVYLQTKTAQTVCVVDASGKIQNKTLEAGVGTSVYGKPPLKVLTSGAAQVDIYYQGVKVRLSNITAKNILLEPAEMIQPLAPTDSQFR
jgi:transcriptional regulator with XRE-family HTH domain